jgi:predicted nucleic-acid-binding Zn-ribbon protein
MPPTTQPIPRSIFLACYECPTCGARWFSGTLSGDEAAALQVVLKLEKRGFRIVTCEHCWSQGNQSADVQFWFSEHPIH